MGGEGGRGVEGSGREGGVDCVIVYLWRLESYL